MSETIRITTLDGDMDFMAYVARPEGEPRAAIIVCRSGRRAVHPPAVGSRHGVLSVRPPYLLYYWVVLSNGEPLGEKQKGIQSNFALLLGSFASSPRHGATSRRDPKASKHV